MKITCTQIVYDIDDEDPPLDLPSTMAVIVDDNLCGYELEEAIANAISDETGWCVTSFKSPDNE
jgi:hypothetical protein